MSLYKSNLAMIYGLDLRTFNNRLKSAGLMKQIPELAQHKGLLSEEDQQKIAMAIGTPQTISRYVRTLA